MLCRDDGLWRAVGAGDVLQPAHHRVQPVAALRYQMRFQTQVGEDVLIRGGENFGGGLVVAQRQQHDDQSIDNACVTLGTDGDAGLAVVLVHAG